MKKQYLVIWQLSDNDQSKSWTPLDIAPNDSAKETFETIKEALCKQTNTPARILNILGIYPL